MWGSLPRPLSIRERGGGSVPTKTTPALSACRVEVGAVGSRKDSSQRRPPAAVALASATRALKGRVATLRPLSQTCRTVQCGQRVPVPRPLVPLGNLASELRSPSPSSSAAEQGRVDVVLALPLLCLLLQDNALAKGGHCLP